MGEEYLTTKETQEYLKVSSVTLWRLVKEGKLPVYKIHNRNRYRKADLDAFMEAHRVGPPKKDGPPPGQQAG